MLIFNETDRKMNVKEIMMKNYFFDLKNIYNVCGRFLLIEFVVESRHNKVNVSEFKTDTNVAFSAAVAHSSDMFVL